MYWKNGGNVVIIAAIIYVKGPISLKTIKDKAASSSGQAVHCTTQGVPSTQDTTSIQIGDRAFIKNNREGIQDFFLQC